MINASSRHAAHAERLVARQAATYSAHKRVPVSHPTVELMAAHPVSVQLAAGNRQLLRLAPVGVRSAQSQSQARRFRRSVWWSTAWLATGCSRDPGAEVWPSNIAIEVFNSARVARIRAPKDW